MPDSFQQEPKEAVTLGRHLSAIRGDRRMSLRQVEEATNREISNAYLSQLENDRIRQPSPRILQALADLYGVSCTSLMEKAGYLRPASTQDYGDNYARGGTFSDMNITDEEEAELLRFLQFMRSGSPSRQRGG